MGDIALLLAQEGHQVKVLAGVPHKVSVAGGSVDAFAENDVSVIRCHVSTLGGGGMKNYLRHYLSFVWSSILGGIRLWRQSWRPDVVFCTSPPLFTGISGRALSLLFWRPLVLDVRDIWPDSAVAANQLSEGGTAYRIGRILENRCYGWARHITCVAEPMASYIRGKCKIPVSVAYNGVQLKQVPPYKKPNGDKESHTIVYAGNLGHVQEVSWMVQEFLSAQEEGMLKNWKLRLIGDGAKRDEIATIIEKSGSGGTVTLESPVLREEVVHELQSADALYLGLMHSHVLEHTIPSKVFDYLAVGRPIVAALAGEGRSILESTDANICCEPGNTTELRNAFVQLQNDIEKLQSYGEDNRKLVLQRFTRQKAVATLSDIFRGFEDPGGSASAG